jgi:DNA-binding transcriptional ArsR family regulator
MLFKIETLERIRTGEVTLAFRRWTRPTVQAGGTLRTAVGVLAIDSLRPVALSEITQADAVRAGYASRARLVADLERRADGALCRIAFRWLGEDPWVVLRAADDLTPSDVEGLALKLAALDGRGGAGAWTRAVLALVAAREGTTAGEIAEALGVEKAALKLRVRKLKELGLTESLRSGYRLSPRGRALVAVLWGGAD